VRARGTNQACGEVSMFLISGTASVPSVW